MDAWWKGLLPARWLVFAVNLISIVHQRWKTRCLQGGRGEGTLVSPDDDINDISHGISYRSSAVRGGRLAREISIFTRRKRRWRTGVSRRRYPCHLPHLPRHLLHIPQSPICPKGSPSAASLGLACGVGAYSSWQRKVNGDTYLSTDPTLIRVGRRKR